MCLRAKPDPIRIQHKVLPAANPGPRSSRSGVIIRRFLRSPSPQQFWLGACTNYFRQPRRRACRALSYFCLSFFASPGDAADFFLKPLLHTMSDLKEKPYIPQGSISTISDRYIDRDKLSDFLRKTFPSYPCRAQVNDMLERCVKFVRLTC
jgi:hypothetical protein